jgi:hypothetical protein
VAKGAEQMDPLQAGLGDRNHRLLTEDDHEGLEAETYIIAQCSRGNANANDHRVSLPPRLDLVSRRTGLEELIDNLVGLVEVILATPERLKQLHTLLLLGNGHGCSRGEPGAFCCNNKPSISSKIVGINRRA